VTFNVTYFQTFLSNNASVLVAHILSDDVRTIET